MAHPFKSQSDAAGKSKMHTMVGAGSKGGWQNGNTAGDKYGLKRAEGGKAGGGDYEGTSAQPREAKSIFQGEMKKAERLDRHARGGKTKSRKSPKVNIKIVAPNKSEPPISPVAAPLGAAALSGGLPPAAPPPLMPPMGMRKRGGIAKRADGGKVTGSSYPKSIKPNPTTPTEGGTLSTEQQIKFLKRARGGAAMKKYPITGGAEGGLGRIQLSHAQKRDRLARGG